jgi:hypothetical protein
MSFVISVSVAVVVVAVLVGAVGLLIDSSAE